MALVHASTLLVVSQPALIRAPVRATWRPTASQARPRTSKPTAAAAFPSERSCVAKATDGSSSRIASAVARCRASSGPERGRERIRSALEDGGLQPDQLDAVKQLEQPRTTSGDLVIVEATGEPRPIDGPQAFHPNKLARDRPLDARPGVEGVGLPKDDPEDDRRIDVRDQPAAPGSRRSRRSSRRSSSDETPRSRGGYSRSRTVANGRFDGRIATDFRADTGTIRAIGRARSMTSTTSPASTARRWSERLSFSSAIPTRFMAISSHNRPREVKFDMDR